MGVGGAGKSGGRKMETTVLEQQLKKKKKKIISIRCPSQAVQLVRVSSSTLRLSVPSLARSHTRSN